MGSLKGLSPVNKVLDMMYGKPQTFSPPAVPDPAAVPTVPSEVGESEYKKAAKRAGRAKTIVTGDLEPETKGKKILFGGV